MKKNHLFVAAVIALTMAAGVAKAQQVKGNGFTGEGKPVENMLNYFEAKDAVNFRAVRDFKKSYPEVKGESWYSFKDGFAVKFMGKGDGLLRMVFYNRGGSWFGNMTYLQEKNLPVDVRAAVKTTYYDYSIDIAEEVELQGQVVYVIHMHDQNNLKVVTYSDGQLNTIQDLTNN